MNKIFETPTAFIQTGVLACVVTLAGCASVTITQSSDRAVAGADGDIAASAYADSPIADAIARADASVEKICAVPTDKLTFDNTVGAVDDVVANLELGANMTMFMAYVSTDAEQRAAGQQAEQDATNWLIELGKNGDLYKQVRAYADTKPKLEGEQKRLLEKSIRDYRRSGMELTPANREQLTKVQKELNKLSIDFESNIRTDETILPFTLAELGGMDEDYLKGLRRSGDMYLVGLSYTDFLPIMDRCNNELTRKKLWIAYKRRGGKKNVGVLEQILELRAEQAELLGYDTPADYETEIKMAKDAATVMAFYEELRPLVRRKALLDLEEFTDAKRRHTGNPDAELMPWDTSFYKNRLMAEKYAVDSEKVREYFPLDAVMDGLFSITQSLYGISYEEITKEAESRGRPLWHEDARLFEVTDTASGDVLGEFYIDLHPRPNKYGHAAQWGLGQHKVWQDGTVNKPLAALVCNFTKPTATKPSLMTHDEVETFFHEFGHCLHTILSTAHYWDFAGTGVERDFVEAPSQMFENWVWDADVLNTFARHYETGELLPTEMLDGMIAARNLGSGMAAERQFYYGLFDMNCHLKTDGIVDTSQLALDLWDPEKDNIELYDPVDETYFHAAFGHLTGYQAGYYGYQWSLVYACDMFQRFKELGMLDPAAGKYYRDTILARGGTVDGIELVEGYLGREPDKTAYLKHLGLDDE